MPIGYRTIAFTLVQRDERNRKFTFYRLFFSRART